jgi:uncharacterized OB-fold protein
MSEAAELIVIPGTWNFEYRYFAGATASRFFIEIRDNCRIMGTRCAKSGKVLVPARSFSDAEYAPTGEWVETGPGGVLEVFTIVGTKFPGLPDPPYVMGYVTLDGADTAILNYISGIDLSDLSRAATFLMTRPRVRAVFSEVRQGRISDFHFVVERVEGT